MAGAGLKGAARPIWVSDGVASPRWTPVSPVSGEFVPCDWKAPFEMPHDTDAELATPALAGPAEAAPAQPSNAAAPVKVIEPPRMVSPQRPPDDPGLPEDYDSPPGSPRKSLPADG